MKTFIAIILVLSIIPVSGCDRDLTGLDLAPGNTDPIVFDDDFGASVEYGAFLYSDYNALSIDSEVRHSGTASLKVTVPDAGSFAGGAFYTRQLRDFTVYNALTFWARAGKSSQINTVGFANDNTGTSKYMVEWQNVPVDTEWKKYIVPIPNPQRLRREGGLFFYAEGAEGGASGHDLWFDDIRFEYLEPGTITNPRPEMASASLSAFVGAEVTASGTMTVYNVNGTDQEIIHMPGYLTFISSNEQVAAVIGGEQVKVVGEGTASITATLSGVTVAGAIQLTAVPAPTVPAPDPTAAAGNVISMFSDEYDDIQVDTWSANWPDQADVQNFSIGGNIVKAYTNLVYAGITFENDLIDATDMDFFHIDIWVPESVTFFGVKLVDFGADGAYLGAPDSEGRVLITSSSDPALVKGQWMSIDIPIERFMNGPSGLYMRDHLAQMLFESNNGTAFVDNVFFHKLP